VNPVNDAPVAVADSITVAEGGIATVLDGGASSILSNDTDAENDPLTAILVTAPANGVLALNSNGTFTSDVNDRGQTVTQQLIQLLKNNPGVRTADFENISGEKGLGRDRARSFLKGGVKAGTVRLDKGQHNTQCHVWIGGDSEVEDGLF